MLQIHGISPVVHVDRPTASVEHRLTAAWRFLDSSWFDLTNLSIAFSVLFVVFWTVSDKVMS